GSVASSAPEPSGLGFTRYPGAVQWPSESDWVPPREGIQHLVPSGTCVLGLGTYANGYRNVTANWIGTPDCHHLRITTDHDTQHSDGAPGLGNGWGGSGLASGAAATLPGGTVLSAHSDLRTRHRDGTVTTLADLGLPGERILGEGGDTGRADALAVLADGRILVGGGTIIGSATTPLLWISDTGGRTVRRVALPAPGPAAARSSWVESIATDHDTVIAFGGGSVGGARSQPILPVWRSADAGRTWSVSVVTGIPELFRVVSVVRAGGRWVAVGTTNVRYTPGSAVLTSADGVHWAPGTPMGRGEVSAATVDASGELVLTGSEQRGTLSGPAGGPGNPRSCGLVWTGDGIGPWRRGELGCGDSPPQAAVTLPGGRVLIASNRDLWIRTTSAP
ncbi:MAG: hypothetical protein QOI35_527, partial [Cryptosporangiaceae bacterium]|nr:hypothetical protein [Cryptosporangiaceae bacterium]